MLLRTIQSNDGRTNNAQEAADLAKQRELFLEKDGRENGADLKEVQGRRASRTNKK